MLHQINESIDIAETTVKIFLNELDKSGIKNVRTLNIYHPVFDKLQKIVEEYGTERYREGYNDSENGLTEDY